MNNGAIWLDGEFAIGEVQNHWPSAGVPQSFSASLIIKGRADDNAKYNTQISEAVIVFREEDQLRPPTIDRMQLFLPQPISSYPIWQFVLTQVPADSHYIAFNIDGTTPDGKTASWAFLQSTSNSFVQVGPPEKNERRE